MRKFHARGGKILYSNFQIPSMKLSLNLPRLIGSRSAEFEFKLSHYHYLINLLIIIVILQTFNFTIKNLNKI